MRNRPNYQQRKDQQIESAGKMVDLHVQGFLENGEGLAEMLNSMDFWIAVVQDKLHADTMGLVDPEWLMHMQNHPGYIKA